MGEITSRDTGRHCFSVKDTLQAVDMGPVENLLVWENLGVNRYELRSIETGEETVLHLSKKEQEEERSGPDEFFLVSETSKTSITLVAT